jgi:hypothetical protein
MGKNQDPGSGIRDLGSGIRDKHPGSATLLYAYTQISLRDFQASRVQTASNTNRRVKPVKVAEYVRYKASRGEMLWYQNYIDAWHNVYQKGKYYGKQSEAEFLEEIQTKVLRVFLLAIHSRLYSFASRFLFLQTCATLQFFEFSYCTYTVKEQGGKPDRKPYPLPNGLRNP